MIIIHSPKGEFILEGVEEQVALALLEKHNPLTVTELAEIIYGKNYTIAQRNYILNLLKKLEKKGIVKLEKKSGIIYAHRNFRPLYLSFWLPITNVMSTIIIIAVAYVIAVQFGIKYAIPLFAIVTFNLLVLIYELFRYNPKLINIIKKIYIKGGR